MSSPGHCSCPDCGTILRIRDRSFVGRQIECPECQVKLVIKLNDERTLIAERPKIDKRKDAAKESAGPVVKTTSPLAEKLGGIAKSPLVLAWALAISLTAFVAIMMLRPSVRFRTPTNETPQATAAANPHAQVSKPEPAEVTPSSQSPQPKVTTATDIPNPAAVAVTEPTTPPDPSPAEAPTVETSNNVPPSQPEKPDLSAKPVVPVPVLVKINVEDRLTQKFEGVTTKTPISRKQMLELIEEMLGEPLRIRYDKQELGEKNLDKPVSLDLDSTTVGGILKALVEPAGWEYLIEETGIRVKPRRVAGSP